MNIDKNEKEIAALAAHRAGDRGKFVELQDEFVADLQNYIANGNDHCPCQNKLCKEHGKCVNCVAIHRAHRDHLPVCFRDMVNERLHELSALTEHTLKKTKE